MVRDGKCVSLFVCASDSECLNWNYDRRRTTKRQDRIERRSIGKEKIEVRKWKINLNMNITMNRQHSHAYYDTMENTQ